MRPEILEHLRKDPPYLVLSRIRSGRDLGAIVGSAHFSYQYHADPEDEQEADLIAGIVQEVHDWSDTWSDIEPGDHVRIQYRLGEAIKEIEAAGWSVFAGKRSGRREFGGVTDRWTWHVLAVLRGEPKQVVHTGDNLIVAREEGPTSGA